MRIALGLILSPIIPNGLSGLFLYALSLGPLWVPFSWFIPDYLLWTELWAVGMGLVVFLLLPRHRRTTPGGCLLLGAIGAFFFPTVWSIYRFGVSEASFDMVVPCAVSGIVALPFGLLGGSIFWFIAFRAGDAPSATGHVLSDGSRAPGIRQ